MIAKDEVVGISITLTVSKRQVLLILLAADGSINRMGTGEEDDDNDQLYRGDDGNSMFEQLCKSIDPELDRWSGRFSDAEQAGQPCCLTIGLVDQEKREIVCQFEYGTESNGPPEEICEFVVSAVEITEQWYEGQGGSPKP